jgi:acyl-CoA synthetase (AMP-forming)/AMP-acid ligase II
VEKITKDIICKDACVGGIQLSEDNKVSQHTLDIDALKSNIRGAKELLINEYDVKKGQKVILNVIEWPEYVVWFFACSELGLKFIISDFPKSEMAFKHVPLLKEADLMIYDLVYASVYDKLPTKILNIKKISSLPKTNNDPILCEPEDIMFIATTSGTTSTPKIVEHTQRFIYNLSIANMDMYGLNENEVCYHNKNLQHGSVSPGFFLPALIACKEHYHAPFGYFKGDREELYREESFRQMITTKSNRLVLFFNQFDWFVDCVDKFAPQLGTKPHIHVIGVLKKEQLDTLFNKLDCVVIPGFGTTESSGALFYKEISRENYESTDLLNYGVANPFYNIEVENEMLYVTLPDGKKIETGDKFKHLDDNTFKFLGRSDIYSVDAKRVFKSFLDDILEQEMEWVNRKDFDLTFDQSNEEWFLRTNTNIDLETLNQKIKKHANIRLYSISDYIVADRKKFINGWKYSDASVRLHFEKKRSGN